jgi:holin-like protein
LKFLKQFGIIMFLAFLGEALRSLLPFPIPASIYGIALLFFCLEWKILPVSSVKEVSVFLIELMPVMFIPAAVGLMDSWDILKPELFSYIVIIALTTVAVMAASGKTAQALLRRKERKGRNKK